MAAAAPPVVDTRTAVPEPELPAHLHPMSFVTRLEWRLANDPPKQKGQRTRERLKLACARLLERHGFHNLKAGDVSAEAGLAEGSFYLYFTDKRDITRTVLGEFQDMFFGVQLGPAGRGGDDPFQAIRLANRVWIAYARTNAGLLRCLYQFADEDAAFSAEVQKLNMRWHQRVMRSTQRKGGQQLSDAEALLLVYCLGGMMDDLARRLIVYPDAELIGLLDDMGATDTALADVASLVWLRILQPGAALPEALAGCSGAIAGVLFPAA